MTVRRSKFRSLTLRSALFSVVTLGALWRAMRQRVDVLVVDAEGHEMPLEEWEGSSQKLYDVNEGRRPDLKAGTMDAAYEQARQDAAKDAAVPRAP